MHSVLLCAEISGDIRPDHEDQVGEKKKKNEDEISLGGKTRLNLEYAMYNRCTAGTGDWEVERQGNQPFVILDEWCAIKADIVYSREYSHYMELAIRRGRLAMLSNVVSIVQYFWNLPGLPLCRHISQLPEYLERVNPGKKPIPILGAEYINC